MKDLSKGGAMARCRCGVNKYEEWSVVSACRTQTPASKWRGLVAEWDKALGPLCPEMRRDTISTGGPVVWMLAPHTLRIDVPVQW
jgi:hypothetical protein